MSGEQGTFTANHILAYGSPACCRGQGREAEVNSHCGNLGELPAGPVSSSVWQRSLVVASRLFCIPVSPAARCAPGTRFWPGRGEWRGSLLLSVRAVKRSGWASRVLCRKRKSDHLPPRR